jgi:F0F1-type ATP synthase membrane subunit b/b'
VSKFVDRMVGRASKQEDNVLALTRLSDYTARADSPEDGTPEEPADYGKLGEHVTSVLEAANQAAEKIHEQARGGARQITERAQQEASALLEKARAEIEELSGEAHRVRIEAEEESREMRERANAYATEKRREADREASALVAQAKRDASELEQAARARSAELERDVESSEQRLRQLVGGLRDLAVRLEELLAAGHPVDAPDSDESMDESLRHAAAAQGAPQRSE